MLSCSGKDRDSNFVPPEREPTFDWSKITRKLTGDANKGELEMLLTGTAPLTSEWNDVNWNKVTRQVRQLQTRIVKYLKQGKMWQVKKLQRLLRHSFSAALLAVRRVTENKGKDTPGIDGVLLDTPNKKWEVAQRSTKTRGYKPLTLKRIMIPKKDKKKKRPLGIPAIFDRAVQALHLIALDPIAEHNADFNSYGFRKERSIHDAIESCFINLSHKNNAEWILEGDITGCFDNISHDWTLANIPTDKTILKKWLKCGYMYKNKLFPTEAGTPQGGIISPVIANMTLDGLEALIKQKFKRHKVNYIRYADDFIVTGDSREILENKVKPLIIEFLKIRGLKLSQAKTKITHIQNGFDFLGFNIKKYNKGKLLIKPSKASIKSILTKTKEIIKKHRQSKQEKLIYKLNEVIQGWGNNYAHVVSKNIFSHIDSIIWKRLWKWARRRHKNKNWKWIKKKYYQTRDNENWVFATGKLRLFRLASIPIRRHTKIRGEAIPYDEDYEVYFEKRWSDSWKKEPVKKKKILWMLQKGKCSGCNQRLNTGDELHIHHKIMKCNGGKDIIENLELLHGVCHRQLHAKKKIIEKESGVDVARCLI